MVMEILRRMNCGNKKKKKKKAWKMWVEQIAFEGGITFVQNVDQTLWGRREFRMRKWNVEMVL